MSEVRRVVGVLEQAVGVVMIRLSVNVTAELITDTPVDLGWARANWVPQTGFAFLGNTGNLSDDERAAGVPGQSALQQSFIASLAATYTLDQGPVFIANNVPYILSLNEGSSRQAPAGFVQAAISRGIESIAGDVEAL